MATPTTVRVVFNNTLQIAVDGTTQAVKVPHRSEFDPRVIKSQLGISVSQWNDFMYRMKALAERKIDHHEAQQYFQSVLCGIDKPVDDPSKLPNYCALNKVQKLYHGEGRGSLPKRLRGACSMPLLSTWIMTSVRVATIPGSIRRGLDKGLS